MKRAREDGQDAADGNESLIAAKRPRIESEPTPNSSWQIDVSEKDFGMILYVNPQPPVSAIIKARYEDFHVSEIDLNNQIVHLTSLEIPKELIPQAIDPNAQKPKTSEDYQKFVTEGHEKLCALIDQHASDKEGAKVQMSKFKEFVETNLPANKEKLVGVKPEDNLFSFDTDALNSKEFRVQFYEIFKKFFPFLVGDTKVENQGSNSGKKTIRIRPAKTQLSHDKMLEMHIDTRKYDKNDPKNSQNKKNLIFSILKQQNPSLTSNPRHFYLKFVLYKENVDTMTALKHISTATKIPLRNFNPAGTKDKRGVTVQHITAKDIFADSIERLNNPSRLFHNMHPNCTIKCGDFTVCENPLSLGDLKGNQFKIVLRNVSLQSGDASETIKTLENQYLKPLSENGFINYFGMQRFGISNRAKSRTHVIGKLLLQQKWEQAAWGILSSKSLTDEELTAMEQKPRLFGPEKDAIALTRALKIFSQPQTQQGAEGMSFLEEAHSLVPRYLTTEKQMLLSYLKNNSVQAHQNAINDLPKSLRMLYIHGYQSWIWNKIASERISKYGLKPVVGDLYYENPEEIVEGEVEVDADAEIEAPIAVDFEEKKDKKQKNEEKEAKQRTVPQYLQKPKLITTEQEIIDKKLTIFNVVLPIPGFMVDYPTHEINREAFETEMQKNDLGNEDNDQKSSKSGITLKSFEDLQKKFQTYGGYRLVMTKPKDFAWEFKEYNDFKESLLQSDYQKIVAAKKQSKPEEPKKEVSETPEQNKKELGLVLQFSLPSSSYATMLFREFTKCEQK